MTDTPTVEPTKADSLSIRDNRTGREYDIPITDGTIRAADLKPRIRQHGLVPQCHHLH
jgi:citrate synthase